MCCNSPPRYGAVSKKSTRVANAEELPLLIPPLGGLVDPSDPLEAWQHCGDAASLLVALQGESLGVLLAMQRHPRMPPGKPFPATRSRARLAQAIVARLQRHLE